MATAGGTPQLNSRNQAFLSPPALRSIPPPRSPRLGSPLTAEPTMPLTKPNPSVQPRPPPGHGRSSSFFSFRNKDKTGSGAESLYTAKSNDTNVDAVRTSFEVRAQQPLPQPMNKSTAPPSQAAGQQAPAQGNPLHPEIRSIISLIVAHAHKVYFSGPLVRRVERQPDGQKPHKDEGWTQVWAQLGGTTLSVWDMKAVEEASKRGEEVPPTYVNMTDAFVQVLGSVTVAGASNGPSQKFANVLTLNTAGSNLILFSCPTPESLMSWAAAFRLSAWEKARLEEIYTAHLIRITFNNQNPGKIIPTTLVRGKLEGWARVRIAGQTDWKQVWFVITAGSPPSANNAATAAPNPSVPQSPAPKKNRMSMLFSRESQDGASTTTTKSSITLFSSPKQKDKKSAVLTMHDVSQVFAVYPERPELITRSTLIKVEGMLGSEEAASTMAGREGWLLIMPVIEGGENQCIEMLKWLTALHDAFRLYGRPEGWSWDPYDTRSLMFAYPVGETKDQLFLDRDAAEQLDPRDDRTSAIRSGLLSISKDMRRGGQRAPMQPIQETPSTQNSNHQSQHSQQPGQSSSWRMTSENPPSLPPIGESNNGPQIPPFTFDAEEHQPENGLDPIKEASTSTSQYSDNEGALLQSTSQLTHEPTKPNQQREVSQTSVFDRPIASSPSPTLSTSRQNNGTVSPPPVNGQHSYESYHIPKDDPQQNFHANSINKHESSAQRTSGSPPPRFSRDTPLNQNRISSAHSHPSSGRPSLDLRSPPPLTTVEPPSHNYGQPSQREASLGVPSYALHDDPTGNKSVNSLNTPPTPTSILTSPHSPYETPRHGYSSLNELTESTHGSPKSSVAPRSIKAKEEANTITTEPRTVVSPQHRPVSPPTRLQSPASMSTHSSNSIPPSRQFTSERQGREVVGATQPGFTRRPSGARVLPASKQHTLDERLSPLVPEEGSEASSMSESVTQRAPPADSDNGEDLDALAALSYLDVGSDDQAHPPEKPTDKKEDASLSNSRIAKLESLEPTPNQESGQFRSSFAPSKQANERKAKAQAHQAAHHAATHQPGRAGRGPTKPAAQGTWSSEEEDEEEDEEEEDDEAESDGIASKPKQSASSNNNAGEFENGFSQLEYGQQPHPRPPRTLPQPPGSGLRSNDSEEFGQRRHTSNQYAEAGRGTQYGGTQYGDAPQIRYQNDAPLPGAARQTVWSSVLDPRKNDPVPDNGKFVQLEDSAQMTKAFTPQGLLSAGLQDKQDRSAKRQEELARESGASLVNVPNKPPPPQSGLLGAITAHERDRKREGGMGAALTERERERRFAEERQRKFDEAQRQQLEQMQTGSMYGNQYGYNPMAMNPMMMGGMNPMMPMMTGGPMSPMMTGQMGYPGYNPQHMFAAQQAAQAYQQAMMAFSVAGSQAGGDAGQHLQQPQQMGPMNPMMTGGGMGFDPRMTMMSGMNGMGGMGMVGNPMMNPMGMQMTGMSQFDPRFGPGQTSPSSELAPSPNGLSSGPFLGQSGSSSPMRNGSPLARSTGTGTPDNTKSPARP